MVISSYIIVDYMRQSKVHLLEHSGTHPSSYSSRSFRPLQSEERDSLGETGAGVDRAEP